MRLRMDFPFSSSHILPRHPGRCRNLHGHNYVLQVQVKGPVDPSSGMVVDFDDLSRLKQWMRHTQPTAQQPATSLN